MNFFDVIEANANDAFTRCIGIDPHPEMLKNWGLENSASGAREFAVRMLTASAGHARIIKPQVAFFERFGLKGYEALSDVIIEARKMGFLVLADAKRSDIGSTIDAYAQAWLGDDSSFKADAITVVPYFGIEALEPVINRAADTGTYVFVVLRSSNVSGKTLQEHGKPYIWHELLARICERQNQLNSQTIGVVVGATAPDAIKYAAETLPEAAILVPGVGAQGGKIQDLDNVSPKKNKLVVSLSRSLAEAGPNPSDIQQAIESNFRTIPN